MEGVFLGEYEVFVESFVELCVFVEVWCNLGVWVVVIVGVSVGRIWVRGRRERVCIVYLRVVFGEVGI